MTRLALLWCGAVAFASSACAPEHLLTPGSYSVTVLRTLRDDCGLAAAPEIAGPLELDPAEDIVRLRYALFQARLTGFYLEQSEAFSADGTVQNVTAPLAGQTCRIDMVRLHLEARTLSRDAFGGELSATLESEQAGCDCVLWAQYEARK